MLSFTLSPVDGFAKGSHPLVKKLMDGCCNLNPPQPRYTSMWDPDVVLRPAPFISLFVSEDSDFGGAGVPPSGF